MSHAIITGGSSGIGLAIAEDLLARGYAVTLIARRAEGLAAARQVLSGEVHTAACDVCDEAALARVMADAQDRLGPCEVLVTSAGIARPGAFETLEPEEFCRQMDVNYLGTLHAVRAVYQGMVTQGQGRIAVISSAAGLMGVFGYTAYSPSKFAVRGFAEALRMEARPQGISVCICFPPDTQTPQLEAEQAHLPPETKAIAGAVKVMSAKDVAQATVTGMLAGRFAIYPNATVSILGRLCSLIHPLLDWHFGRIIDRVRRS